MRQPIYSAYHRPGQLLIKGSLVLATPGDPLSSIAPPRDAPSSPLGGTVAYRVKRDPTPVGSDPKDARHSVKQSSKHCPLHHQRLSLLPPVQRETVAGGPSRSSRSLPLLVWCSPVPAPSTDTRADPASARRAAGPARGRVGRAGGPLWCGPSLGAGAFSHPNSNPRSSLDWRASLC